jgi:hypothetical protein
VQKQEQLKAEYKELLYNYSIPTKAKRKRLRKLEQALAQYADIKPGMFFYESWGYDQTNIDFLEVMEVSPTKKTVLCRMVGKNRVSSGLTSDNVSPDNSYRGPTLFRLRVGFYSDGVTLRGSYPFCENYYPACKLADKEKAKGSFECPMIETDEKNYLWWSSGQKRAWCKGCEHYYKELNVSYRKGSFSKYEHPMYETALGFGH